MLEKDLSTLTAADLENLKALFDAKKNAWGNSQGLSEISLISLKDKIISFLNHKTKLYFIDSDNFILELLQYNNYAIKDIYEK